MDQVIIITADPAKDLALATKLNGQLIDVNRKLSRESVELVNTLETARKYLERKYHPDNIKDALAAINVALVTWGKS